jgi:hypothetical protein
MHTLDWTVTDTGSTAGAGDRGEEEEAGEDEPAEASTARPSQVRQFLP